MLALTASRGLTLLRTLLLTLGVTTCYRMRALDVETLTLNLVAHGGSSKSQADGRTTRLTTFLRVAVDDKSASSYNVTWFRSETGTRRR